MNFFSHSVLVVGLTAALSSPAQAATISISFDEPGINANDTLTTQYSNLGLTFSGTLAKVKSPASFGNPFPADGKVLHFDLKPVAAFLDIAAPAAAIAFDFRRPDAPGAIGVSLFDGANLVHDFGSIPWPGPDWLVFSYDGSFGTFDRVRFTGAEKFVIDNLSVTTVPVPASMLLLAAALPLLRRGRARSAAA